MDPLQLNRINKYHCLMLPLMKIWNDDFIARFLNNLQRKKCFHTFLTLFLFKMSNLLIKFYKSFGVKHPKKKKIHNSEPLQLGGYRYARTRQFYISVSAPQA